MKRGRAGGSALRLVTLAEAEKRAGNEKEARVFAEKRRNLQGLSLAALAVNV